MQVVQLALLVALAIVLAVVGFSAWTKYRKHQKRRGM